MSNKGKFADLLPKIHQKVDAALNAANNELAQHVQDAAPTLTGALRDSIEAEKIGDLKYTVGTDLDYAPEVELGAEHTPAEPFMRPCFPKHVEETVRRISNAIKRA